MRTNNPRAVAKSLSLTAWRTSYDADTGKAHLHVDVAFKVGRLGDKPEDKVEFEFHLNGAEVRIRKDPTKSLQIIPETVLKPRLPHVSAKVEICRKDDSSVEGGGALKPTSASAEGKASKGKSTTTKVSFDYERMDGPGFDTHFDNEYVAFEILPQTDSDSIGGRPWDSSESVLSIRDRDYSVNKSIKSEVVIQVICRMENIVIPEETVRLKEGKPFASLFRDQRVVALQALKAEVLQLGLECGDISERFAEMMIADVVTGED